jgi:hypothetical protein
MQYPDDKSPEQLMHEYGLSVDDFGRFSDIAHPNELLINSFYQAGQAAATPRNFSDDDVDYTNAIIDQLTVLREMIFDDDFTRPADETKTQLLALLNAKPNRHSRFDDKIHCFEYGYADHHTDISILAHMNDED